MGANEKKQKFDTTLKTLTDAAKTKDGKLVGIVILVVIILNWISLNVFGTSVKNTIAAEVQTIKSDFAALSAHVTELEEEVGKKTESVDIGALKADAEAIKKTAESLGESTVKASEKFEAKLNALVKTEEAKLATLTKDLENQKAYIDELKSLLTGQ
ncbi:MAG: hypothetical protein LBJ22_06920 [Synergistaceae bacterium]|jgi:SMC interacting uncharacterized protein involved in chromosome segregation|nr:hypothetical protein [Synergistaceae bacterium]